MHALRRHTRCTYCGKRVVPAENGAGRWRTMAGGLSTQRMAARAVRRPPSQEPLHPPAVCECCREGLPRAPCVRTSAPPCQHIGAASGHSTQQAHSASWPALPRVCQPSAGGANGSIATSSLPTTLFVSSCAWLTHVALHCCSLAPRQACGIRDITIRHAHHVIPPVCQLHAPPHHSHSPRHAGPQSSAPEPLSNYLLQVHALHCATLHPSYPTSCAASACCPHARRATSALQPSEEEDPPLLDTPTRDAAQILLWSDHNELCCMTPRSASNSSCRKRSRTLASARVFVRHRLDYLLALRSPNSVPPQGVRMAEQTPGRHGHVRHASLHRRPPKPRQLVAGCTGNETRNRCSCNG